MKKYFASLSFFRVLAFLSVFFLHVSCYNVSPITLDAAWAVNFFFMISAFLYGYKYCNKEVKMKETKKFFIGKFKKLYPIYFIMIILFLPWGGLIYLKSNLFEFTIKLLLLLTMTQSFSTNLEYAYAFNGPTWFISTFMVMMLLTIPLVILLKKIVTNRKRGIITICVLLLLDFLYVNLVYKLNLPTISLLYVFPTSRLFEFMIGIVLGMLFNQTYKEVKPTKKRTIIFTIIEVLTLVLLFFSIKYLPCWFPKYYNSFIWIIPNMIILFVFSYEGGYLSKLMSNKFIIYLGNLTFPAYIVHQFIFVNFYTIPGINDRMRAINKIVAFLYILFICFFIAALLNKIDFNPYFERIGKLFKRKKKKT